MESAPTIEQLETKLAELAAQIAELKQQKSAADEMPSDEMLKAGCIIKPDGGYYNGSGHTQIFLRNSYAQGNWAPTQDACQQLIDKRRAFATLDRAYAKAEGATRAEGAMKAVAPGVNPKARQVTPGNWDTSIGQGNHIPDRAVTVLKREGKNSRIHVDRDAKHVAKQNHGVGFGHGQGSKPRTVGNKTLPEDLSRLGDFRDKVRQNARYAANMAWETGKLRNRRSVWQLATAPFKEAHFATYPPDLARICILGGSREGDIVLDPFMGSGTTAIVAKRLQRKYLGIELNQDYIFMAERRLNQMPLTLFDEDTTS